MVFSRQDEFAADAQRLYAALRNHLDVGNHLGTLAFRDMRHEPALQAADLLAWELRLFYAHQKQGVRTSLRWPLAQLVEMQRAMGASMLKYLPRWYLELQKLGNIEEGTKLMLALPNLYWFFLRQLYHEELGTPPIPRGSPFEVPRPFRPQPEPLDGSNSLSI